jgi:hypothetical protein
VTPDHEEPDDERRDQAKHEKDDCERRRPFEMSRVVRTVEDQSLEQRQGGAGGDHDCSGNVLEDITERTSAVPGRGR